MAGSREKPLGVYGSPQKAESMGLRVTEHYGPLDPEASRKARERGLHYIPVIWVPETKDPGEAVVDAWGRRRLFAFNNSGCITHPNIRKRAREKIVQAATVLEAPAVILDALRFPSPHDGEALFTCFCPHCTRSVEKHGVDTNNLKTNIARLARALPQYPYLGDTLLGIFATWVEERQQLVVEALEELRDEARDHGLGLWAALFPPSLAWLVGQNYALLEPLLDEIHVMLYHRCGGAACLNHELYSLVRLLEREGATTVLRRLTGLDLGNPEHLEHQGLPPGVLLGEAETARTLLGDKAVPILQLDPQGLETAKRLVGFPKTAYLA